MTPEHLERSSHVVVDWAVVAIVEALLLGIWVSARRVVNVFQSFPGRPWEGGHGRRCALHFNPVGR